MYVCVCVWGGGVIERERKSNRLTEFYNCAWIYEGLSMTAIRVSINVPLKEREIYRL